MNRQGVFRTSSSLISRKLVVLAMACLGCSPALENPPRAAVLQRPMVSIEFFNGLSLEVPGAVCLRLLPSVDFHLIEVYHGSPTVSRVATVYVGTAGHFPSEACAQEKISAARTIHLGDNGEALKMVEVRNGVCQEVGIYKEYRPEVFSGIMIHVLYAEGIEAARHSGDIQTMLESVRFTGRLIPDTHFPAEVLCDEAES